VQNLNSKGLRETHSGRTVSAIGRKETMMLRGIRSAQALKVT